MAVIINAKGTSVPSFQIGKNSLNAATIRTGQVDPTILPQPGNNGDLWIRSNGMDSSLYQMVGGVWILYTNQPQVGVLYKQIDYTSTTTDLITLPANAIILSVEAQITTPFDGVAPLL